MRGGSTVFPPGRHSFAWKRELREAVRDVHLLATLLPGISVGPWAERYKRACESASDLQKHFRFAVTPYYLSLARPDNSKCPILTQILPDPEELADPVFSLNDPLAEEANTPVPGLTHRYPDRVLWYLTHHCPVYCRFCMRKRKVSRAGTGPSREEVDRALDYISSASQLREVILSGGDPLSLSEDSLDRILSGLARVPHLVSVRIHTRMPVTLPSRITREFCQMLEPYESLTIVTHFNHSRELTAVATEGLRRLRKTGVLVLNQSVLLRGVNDSKEELSDLFLGLIRRGVKPYYLHQCDEVCGVSHFRVEISKGIQLMKELRGQTTGIALPLYVVDLPGGGGKVPVDGSYMITAEDENSGYVYENGERRRFELSPFKRESEAVAHE